MCVSVCVPDVRIFGHQSGDFQEKQRGVSQFEHFSNGSNSTTKTVCVFTLNTTICKLKACSSNRNRSSCHYQSSVTPHLHNSSSCHPASEWTLIVLLCARMCFDSFAGHCQITLHTCVNNMQHRKNTLDVNLQQPVS